MAHHHLIISVFFFFLGLCIGSFINVCIWRMPRGEKLFFSRSYCPKCKNKIRWYDNIPLLSYVILRGRCRWCKGNISIQYPLIEFVTGAIFLLGYLEFGLGIGLLIFLLLSVVLVIVSGIDFYHRIIFNVCSYGLIITGLLSSIFNPLLPERDLFLFDLLSDIISSSPPLMMTIRRVSVSLMGVAIGGGVLLLIGVIGERILGKEAMGGGDIKLMAGIGAFVGPGKIIWILFLSSLLGAIAGGIMRLIGKNKKWQPIPFGPFISLGSILTILFGNEIIAFYYKLIYTQILP